MSIYKFYSVKNKFSWWKKIIKTLPIISQKKELILGIETSCDDTGCAIVDINGNLLGEALNSQHLIHLNYGGIIPPIAQKLHRENVQNVVNEALSNANLSVNDIDAIAVTVRPGLVLSLNVGFKYGKYLCRKYNKPIIPIHHMEAHALTCRMIDQGIKFPFLVLLISGANCLLAIVEDVDKFILLGDSIDDSPGETFDKMARRLKLRNIKEFAHLSGGAAIELAASRAQNPLQFQFTPSLLKFRNCNFSMSGIKNQMWRHIVSQEKKHDVLPDEVIPDVDNLCAGFQLGIARHLCHRVQRAMEYAKLKNLIPPERQLLVVSGGSACNNFIYKALEIVCQNLEYKIIRPPPKLCTDNGIMIAWNGVEKWRANIDVTTDYDSIDISGDAPLGTSCIEDVIESDIKCFWVRLNVLNQPQQSRNELSIKNNAN